MDTVTTIENLSFAAALRPEVVASATTDHALLEATRVGDEDAFAELVSRYKNQLSDELCVFNLHLSHRDEPGDQ